MTKPGLILRKPKKAFRTLDKRFDSIIKLKNRADFLALNSKLKASARGLYLQGQLRSKEDRQNTMISEEIIRVGFTCSKKVGNSVMRNKARRRLKHIARLCLPEVGQPGWDYVLIGRREQTTSIPFNDLKSSLKLALEELHSKHTGK